MTDVQNVEIAAADAVAQDAFTRALTNFKGTYYFGKAMKDYGSGDEHGIHVQFDYSPDASMEDFLAEARQAALWAKAIVYEQMGVEAHLEGTGTNAVLREVVQDAFPGATTETVQADPADSVQRPTTVTGVGDTPPFPDSAFEGLHYSDAVYKNQQRENKSWAAKRYETHPNEFWDNRAKKASGQFKSGAFDFGHKTHKKSGFYAD